ncbi:hypothetical protein [Stenotrophomonas sp. 278]|uniref:hypothetical protein n=1 Tax=Stenotrophomonas sp. 278 TaxID=2479851 RepID=UPI001639BB07|nr:hypothetical protein [Stenotrophomonas sp. 278]
MSRRYLTLQWEKHEMKRILSLAVALIAPTTCLSMPNLSDMRANAAWKGRPVSEAVSQFGAPNRIETDVGKQVVVLVYARNTAHTSREALGTYTGPQDGRLVHVESYGDVTRRSECEIRVAVNRARQVARIWKEGGYCWQLDIGPKNPG